MSWYRTIGRISSTHSLGAMNSASAAALFEAEDTVLFSVVKCLSFCKVLIFYSDAIAPTPLAPVAALPTVWSYGLHRVPPFRAHN